jgi:HEAT repeat protein
MACIQPSKDAALVAEAKRNSFVSARDLKAATGFSWQRGMAILRLKEAGLRAQHAAVKEHLTDEQKLYRLAFVGSIIDHK